MARACSDLCHEEACIHCPALERAQPSLRIYFAYRAQIPHFARPVRQRAPRYFELDSLQLLDLLAYGPASTPPPHRFEVVMDDDAMGGRVQRHAMARDERRWEVIDGVVAVYFTVEYVARLLVRHATHRQRLG